MYNNNNLTSRLIVFIVGYWSTIKVAIAALAMASRHKLPCSHNTGSKMVLLYGDLLTGGEGGGVWAYGGFSLIPKPTSETTEGALWWWGQLRCDPLTQCPPLFIYIQQEHKSLVWSAAQLLHTLMHGCRTLVCARRPSAIIKFLTVCHQLFFLPQ